MKFMALGATDYIGASCYYLELADTKLLLDVGRGHKREHVLPHFNFFDKINISLSELDGVILSHGHYDHAGALPEFIINADNVPIYSTNMTKALLSNLILDKIYDDSIKSSINNFLTDKLKDKIITYGFRKEFKIKNVNVTFYEAGHVPGAAMIFIDSPEGAVLYTGDFSPRKTALTNGISIPTDCKPDVVIMCGTHAKDRSWQYREFIQYEKIAQELKQKGNVFINAYQLTKGLELMNILSKEFQDVNFYLDNDIMELALRMEEVKMSVLNYRCQRITYNNFNLKKGIYIGKNDIGKCLNMNITASDIGLHASFSECVELLNKLKPKYVFLVHSPGNISGEQIFTKSVSCPVIYPILGHIYDNNAKEAA